MAGFDYLRPATLDEALVAIQTPGATAIGGGTDLVPLLTEGLTEAAQVVDLRFLPNARTITRAEDGSVRLGAAVRIADLASDPLIRAAYPVLAEAAAAVASPALRAMGTLGGNLLQRPRCWYFRRGVSCLKTGGHGCPAAAGEHRYHGIMDAGTCRAAHPSDPAVALEALEAQLTLRSAAGTRSLGVAEFFAPAGSAAEGETALGPGELLTEVVLPAASAGGVQHWEKLIQRGAFDFALVSCAAVRRADGTVRMALGGVGAGPWRVPHSIEEDVGSGGLEDDSIDALAARALYDASPLPGTAYKVVMAEAALRRAIRAIAP